MTAALRFGVLGCAVAVRADCPEVAERLAVCYAALPEPPAAPRASVDARVARRGGTFAVAVSGREAVTAPDVETAVRAVNHEVMHAVMLGSPRLFFVHAAVVSVDGAAIVFPGVSCSGKSTLALALLLRGARLLSDELLVFEPETRTLLAYPRAVKVRDVCVDYFPELRRHFVGEGEARFVPQAALGQAPAERAAPRLVVAPRWAPDADDEIEPRTAGEGVLVLASSALNFGTARAQSIDHLAEVAAPARHCALRWRDPRRAADRVLEALEKA